jgi:hypothetical protein
MIIQTTSSLISGKLQGITGQTLSPGAQTHLEELTPGERIAIRAAAKTAYRKKHLENLVVCADPGNMPFSNRKREGFENKVAQVLGEATGAQVSYYWRSAASLAKRSAPTCVMP